MGDIAGGKTTVGIALNIIEQPLKPPHHDKVIPFRGR